MKISEERYNKMLQANEHFRIKLNIAREGLLEIKKGKGRYSMDKLTHAWNTITDMKKLAKETLEKLE